MDISDEFMVFLESMQNVAMNKMILKMFSAGDMSDKEIDTITQLLTTCNKHGVSTMTLMNIFTDLFESGVFHAE